MGAAAARALGGLHRLAVSRWGVMLALVGIGGLALRIWAYRSILGTPNSDEAIVGLMARHALDGEFTTFFWGQSYGGPQEALLTAPVFLIAGSSWLALRLVPMVLSVVAVFLVWRVGRRTIGDQAAVVAAGLLWIWPPFALQIVTRQHGFYASNLLYCALLLLLALRLVERPDRLRVGLFGLLLGLAFWQTAQIAPIAVAVVAWTIWKQPRSLRHLWLAAPLVALGALPWILWNVEHGWESLTQPDGDEKSYAHRLRVLASPLAAMTVGLRAPGTAELLVPAVLTFLIYAVVVGLFIYGAVKARHRNASLLYLVPVVFPFVYAISSRTFLSSEPRYTVVLVPILVLLLAQLATNYARATAVLALACVVSVVTLHKMDVFSHTGPKDYPATPRDFGPLIATLDRLGVDHVFANYWIAYRLDFDTRERITAVENDFNRVTFPGGRAIPAPDLPVRYPLWEREVGADPRHGFVFFRETLSSVAIVDELERHGYTPHIVGNMVVYAPGKVG